VENLKSLQLTELIDRLASCTEQYTKLYADTPTTEEFNKLKAIIIALQEEIDLRKLEPNKG
jgi:hypothetical protein